MFPLEFPERHGALRKFLLGLHSGWNISLFHYRNHGAGRSLFHSSLEGFVLTFYVQDLGKVLAGIQVPEDEYKEFDEFLEKLSYDYVEETENETYKKYLRG